MIEFYPDLIVKRQRHVVEKLQEPSKYNSVGGLTDLSAEGAAVEIWHPGSWNVRRIALHFSSDASKSCAVSICRGAGVVSGRNDTMWFRSDLNGAGGLPPQSVTIPAGFYTGDGLAAALKARLDAVTGFSSVAPWTVTYSVSTGIFSIVPSAGHVQFYSTNPVVPGVRSRSTAGRMFGLTANAAMSGAISSDSPVAGLGVSTVYISTAATATDVVATNEISMTSDNALIIACEAIASNMAYEVVYETLDI